MPSDLFSQYCGRLYEVAFNCGMLTFLEQQERAKMLTTMKVGSLYRPDLVRLRFQPMVSYVLAQSKNIGPSPQLRQVAEQLLLHFCFKGYLQGLHFLEEYLRALGDTYRGRPLHVRYVQCSFRGDNSLGTIKVNPVDDILALRKCLAQLDPELNSSQLNTDVYSHTGRFLKADCLVLLQWGKKITSPLPTQPEQQKSSQKKGGFLLTHSPFEMPLAEQTSPDHTLPRQCWRILCLDFSAHSLSTGRLRDPNHISTLRQMLLSELGYLRTRGIFSNLSYDVADGLPEMLFSRGLEEYLTAFKKKDKESAKLIQAGGYAYDFFDLLRTKGMIQEDDEVVCDAFGVSDRDMTSIHVRREHMRILETCQKIYQNNPSGPWSDLLHGSVNMPTKSMIKWTTPHWGKVPAKPLPRECSSQGCVPIA